MLSSSLYLIAPLTLRWYAETLPALEPYDVLLETIASSISIGTELPQYRGDERASHISIYPRMTGYENFARVIAIGSAVTRWQTGDTVFAFYGHRTHAIVHEDRPIIVPDKILPENALSAILTCDVAKGIRKLNPLPETRVLVTGGGAIGLYTVAMLRAYGVAQVDLVDPIEKRRQLAHDLGATHTYPDGDNLPQDYAMAFECSSRQAAFALLQTKLAQKGKLCILADGNLEPLVLLPEFHQKELTVIGSSDGWDYPQHAKWFFDYIQRELPPLASIFDVRIVHTHLPATFAQLADGTLSAVKVLVDYQANSA